MFIDAEAAQYVQLLIDAECESQNPIDFVPLLTSYLQSAESIATNDDILLQIVMDELQEYHSYSEQRAIEFGPIIAESAVDAMWSEFSRVIEQESSTYINLIRSDHADHTNLSTNEAGC